MVIILICSQFFNDTIRGMYEKANIGYGRLGIGTMPLSNYTTPYLVPISNPLTYLYPQLPTKIGESKVVNYH